METYTFDYTPGDLGASAAFPSGKPLKRPYLTVFLRNGDKRTHEFQANVDTGADFCMFPSALLTDLGIKKETLGRHCASGLGTDDGAYFAKVALRCDGLGEFEVYAGFSDTVDPTVAMLGHIDFLERFTAAFDYQRGKFALIVGSIE